MAGTGPGFLPKTALVASRAIYFPFTVPQKMNDSSTLVGTELNHAFGGVVGAIGQAFVNLKPRHGMEKLIPVFQKGIDAVKHSDEVQARNKLVWDPATQGIESVGRAIASPGAIYYLHKAGMEQPTQDAVKAVLNMPMFSFPVAGPAPAPSGEGGAPPAEGGAPAPQGEGPAPAGEGPAPAGAGAEAPAQAAAGAGATG